MFTAQLGAVLVVQKNRLQLFTRTLGFKVEVSTEVVNYLELLDAASYKKIVQQLLEQSELPAQKVGLIIDAALLYQKTFSRDQLLADGELIKKELKALPISNQWLSYVEVATPEQHTAVAVNYELLQPILEAFQEAGWKVSGAAPISLFPFSSGQLPTSFGSEVIDNIFINAAEVFKKYSFQQPVQTETSELAEKKKQSGKNENNNQPPNQRVLLVLAISLFVIAASLFLFFFANSGRIGLSGVTLPLAEDQVVVEPQPTVVPLPVDDPLASKVSPTLGDDSTASAELLSDLGEWDKAAVSVLVLNGSGIAGEAGRIAQAVEELGYLDVGVGNTQLAQSNSSTVTVPATFSANLSDELLAALLREGVVASLESTTAATSADIVVVISP